MARYRFYFWLDGSKDDELLIAEEIDDLKRQRLFSKTIRDGIRLIVDLRKGSVDVLLELFPELRRKLKSEPDGGGDDDLHRRIRMLETAVMQQADVLSAAKLPRPALLNTPDSVPIAIKSDSRKDAAQNLVTSLQGLM